ncbi:Phospholipid-transporting ATPase VB [Labeo rohita]|uniref:Phospholipid-transporting ATPase VB n=1 Tax=Labeo rohita TaxID=84645 RepID=A0ABQ8MA51_LABRO|nr:Phospholipid-transporting ATPase VB [Labeo rohita]
MINYISTLRTSAAPVCMCYITLFNAVYLKLDLNSLAVNLTYSTQTVCVTLYECLYRSTFPCLWFVSKLLIESFTIVSRWGLAFFFFLWVKPNMVLSVYFRYAVTVKDLCSLLLSLYMRKFIVDFSMTSRPQFMCVFKGYKA